VGSVLYLKVANQDVGTLDFEESNAAIRRLGARRTSDGFVFFPPAALKLKRQQSDWQPMVPNIRAEIFYDDDKGFQLGVGRDETIYVPGLQEYEQNLTLSLAWYGTDETLQMIDKRRNGGAVKLWIKCTGETCAVPTDPLRNVSRGRPESFHRDFHVEYAADAWTSLMENVAAVGAVLVEVPLRNDLPPAWGPIYTALKEAKRHIARGGDDGWKACVAAVRTALDEWHNLEAEDQGAGWTAPTRTQKESRTKGQRADALRWHLLQFAHLAHHSPSDHWERNDAILAFATLCALLAERDP
jgi:hypothetical protein